MPKYFQVAAGMCSICLLLACSKQPSSESSVADAKPTVQSRSDDNIVPQPLDEVAKPAASEMDYGDWLRLPEGIDSRYSDVYPTLVQLSLAGDASGQVNLAVVSQQLALILARSGEEEAAYKFIAQSGRALRGGLPEGAKQLPPTTIQSIFFNEAGALSRAGQVKEARLALADAVEYGFTNLSALANDEDLVAVRKSEGFSEQLATWQQSILETFRAEAKHDLAAGESFPFELTGTDITGSEISLTNLQGKVVIVDIWGTWCPPCRAEIPSFIKLQDKFSEQGFQMIGLNIEQQSSPEANLAGVVDYVKEMKINYPCILGERTTLAQVPSFNVYPTTLFFDKTGKVRLKAVGLHDYYYLEAVVTELLAE